MSFRPILALFFCSYAFAQSSNGTRLITPVVILPTQDQTASGQLIFNDAQTNPGTAVFQAPLSITAPYVINLPPALTTGCLGFTAGSGSTWNASVVGCSASGAAPSFPVDLPTIIAAYTTSALDFSTCATIPVSAGTFTVTLAASIAQPANGQCVWIVNYGTGVVTVARSGQDLNGGTASIVLPAGSATAPTGTWVVSNGTDYEAEVFGTGGGSATFPVDAPQTANYAATSSDFSTCATIQVPSGTFTITLVASGSQPSNGQCVWIVNYGTGVVTIAASGQDINGGTASIPLGAGSATAPTGAWVVSDGTNYEAEVFGAAVGAICGSNTNVIFNNTGACAGSPNFTWGNTAQVLTVAGVTGTAAINVTTAFIQSGQGFLSVANEWNAFQSNTDGALLRGYGVAPNVAGTAGGYVDYAPITYPPSGSSTCYDAYANPVSQPIPLNGLSAFGSNDLLFWNSTSPSQGYVGGSPYHINGTPCAAPIPRNITYGLNTNGYIFARAGFASDDTSFNAITLFNGGVTAQSITAAGNYPAGTIAATFAGCVSGTNCGTLSGLYGTYLGGYVAIGHSVGVPGNGVNCESIASCSNPLTANDGVEQGTIYWDDALGGVNAFDGTVWSLLAQQNKNVTFGTVTGAVYTSNCGALGSTGFQTDYLGAFNFSVDCNGDISLNGAGLISDVASAGGIGFPNNAARNVYSTLGGFESTCTTAGNIVFSTFNADFEVTCAGNATVNNVVANGTITGAVYTSNCGALGSTGFQTDYLGAFNFSVDCNGDISLNGAGLISDVASAGGIGFPNNAARNVYSTLGGFESTCTTAGNIVFSTFNADFEVTCAGNVTGNNLTGLTFTSTQTGSGATHLAFQTSNNCLNVDGQGNITLTCAGAILDSATTAGFGAPNNAAQNVYSTLGGFESTCTTAGNIVFSTFNADFEVTCAGNATVNNVVANGTITGAVYTSNCGALGSTGFQTDYLGAFNFSVDCNGDISLNGAGLISDVASAGGIGFPNNAARNVYSTLGGFESTCTTAGNIVFSTFNADFEVTCAGNVTGNDLTGLTFTSTQTGSGATHLAFQTSNNCLNVDGQGNITLTCAGAILDSATTAGFGAPNNAAQNVYSTLGGFESTCTTAGNIVFSTFNADFEVTCAGNTTVHNIVINGTCTGCGAASVWTTSGANIYNNNTGNVGINNSSPSEQFMVGTDFALDNSGDITLAGPASVLLITGSGAAGVDVSGCTLYNCIQAPHGGLSGNQLTLNTTTAESSMTWTGACDTCYLLLTGPIGGSATNWETPLYVRLGGLPPFTSSNYPNGNTGLIGTAVDPANYPSGMTPAEAANFFIGEFGVGGSPNSSALTIMAYTSSSSEGALALGNIDNGATGAWSNVVNETCNGFTTDANMLCNSINMYDFYWNSPTYYSWPVGWMVGSAYYPNIWNTGSQQVTTIDMAGIGQYQPTLDATGLHINTMGCTNSSGNCGSNTGLAASYNHGIWIDDGAILGGGSAIWIDAVNSGISNCPSNDTWNFTRSTCTNSASGPIMLVGRGVMWSGTVTVSGSTVSVSGSPWSAGSIGGQITINGFIYGIKQGSVTSNSLTYLCATGPDENAYPNCQTNGSYSASTPYMHPMEEYVDNSGLSNVQALNGSLELSASPGNYVYLNSPNLYADASGNLNLFGSTSELIIGNNAAANAIVLKGGIDVCQGGGTVGIELNGSTILNCTGNLSVANIGVSSTAAINELLVGGTAILSTLASGGTECVQASSIGVLSVTGSGCGGSGGVTSLTGTANQITVSASTGAVTLSIPSSLDVGSINTAGTGTFGGAITANGGLISPTSGIGAIGFATYVSGTPNYGLASHTMTVNNPSGTCTIIVLGGIITGGTC